MTKIICLKNPLLECLVNCPLYSTAENFIEELEAETMTINGGKLTDTFEESLASAISENPLPVEFESLCIRGKIGKESFIL